MLIPFSNKRHQALGRPGIDVPSAGIKGEASFPKVSECMRLVLSGIVDCLSSEINASGKRTTPALS
jgi:hypothetical protein